MGSKLEELPRNTSETNSASDFWSGVAGSIALSPLQRALLRAQVDSLAADRVGSQRCAEGPLTLNAVRKRSAHGRPVPSGGRPAPGETGLVVESDGAGVAAVCLGGSLRNDSMRCSSSFSDSVRGCPRCFRRSSAARSSARARVIAVFSGGRPACPLPVARCLRISSTRFVGRA